MHVALYTIVCRHLSHFYHKSGHHQSERFVCARCYFIVNDLNDIIVYAWGYQDVSKCPGDMLDYGDLERWEEVITKAPFLAFVPCKPVFENHHEIMHELSFLWQ